MPSFTAWRYGRDGRGDELPAELARRETRQKRIREAKRALEERAREQAQSKGEPEEKAKPKTTTKYNFTDPESRIMPGADGFVQAYNAQIAVEPDFQWIVGQRGTQASNDKQQLVPTVEAIGEQAGQKPHEVLTDSQLVRELLELTNLNSDFEISSSEDPVLSPVADPATDEAGVHQCYQCY